MLVLFLKLILVICLFVESKRYDFGDELAHSLIKNSDRKDLSQDEEYEDLKAEFFAYRTALASLTSEGARRSMQTTECWKQNGICINYKLCAGYKFLTEVPGCKDKLKVCCFVWDKYLVKDMRDYGISNIAMPWSLKREFGGEGIVDRTTTRRSKNRSRPPTGDRALALVIKSN